MWPYIHWPKQTGASMCVYICMRLYVHMSTDVSTDVLPHTSTHGIYMCIYMCVHAYVHTHVYTCAFTHASRMSTQISIRTCINRRAHMPTYAYHLLVFTNGLCYQTASIAGSPCKRISNPLNARIERAVGFDDRCRMRQRLRALTNQLCTCCCAAPVFSVSPIDVLVWVRPLGARVKFFVATQH